MRNTCIHTRFGAPLTRARDLHSCTVSRQHTCVHVHVHVAVHVHVVAIGHVWLASYVIGVHLSGCPLHLLHLWLLVVILYLQHTYSG